jgi:hypothetical protein
MMISLFVLVGCGATSKTDSTRPAAAPSSKANVSSAPTPNAGNAVKPLADNRKIIESGQVTLESRDLSVTENRVFSLLETRRGTVESSSVTLDGNGRRNGNYSLRLPASQLTGFVNELSKIPDVVVRQRSLSTKDVTEEFVDISARLENMQRHENRLREILAKANSVDEILKVEKELASVRGQIESTTARLKSLTGKIDMSTLKLRISEVTVITETNFSGKLMAIVRDSWVAAGDVILYLIATIIVLSPIAVIIAVIVWWWKRRQKIKQKARQLQQPMAEPPV